MINCKTGSIVAMNWETLYEGSNYKTYLEAIFRYNLKYNHMAFQLTGRALMKNNSIPDYHVIYYIVEQIPEELLQEMEEIKALEALANL